MTALFVAWQDPRNRGWYPIARLTRVGDSYQFAYTEGANKAKSAAGFEPLPSFPDLDVIYESSELFPLFSNRLPRTSRPDYQEFVEWLNVPADEDDPIVLLARSGGRRATDKLELLPFPEPDSHGQYHIHFFVHGLRYMPPCSIEKVNHLKSGDQLLLMLDFQNEHDPGALLLRTEDSHDNPLCPVGYCPSYLLPDAFELLQRCPVEVTVERVNLPPAPLQLRLLCSLTACWPTDFTPFSGPMYQPIVDQVARSEH